MDHTATHIVMDTQSSQHLFALMPLTQLILAFVATCALIKVGLHALLAQPIEQCSADGAVRGKRAPRPLGVPILGNVLSMAGYELPYQSFGALGRRFGPIIGLQLGNQPSLVVNGIEHIKEVLITKSAHFDSRPNFKRYHDLFSGNKENCKYSTCRRLVRPPDTN